MKLAIMQPYFFPYIGYFQLIAAVDLFILYDNIEYTKKGWINRNRLLQNDKEKIFTLPLKKASDYLDVCERELAPNFNRKKLLNQIKGAYQSAPYFTQTFLLIEQILNYNETNLFRFLHQSILKTCKHLDIETKILISSSIPINHTLKSQGKVLALCTEVGASMYINAIGGKELYSKNIFLANKVELKFIQSNPFEYLQFGEVFIPWLSIIDVLMFNSLDTIKTSSLAQYELR